MKKLFAIKLKYIACFFVLVFIIISIVVCSKPIKNYIDKKYDEYHYHNAIEYYVSGSYQIALSNIENLADSYRDTKIFKEAINHEIQMTLYEKENGEIPEFDDIYIEYLPDILETEKIDTPQLYYDATYQAYINATWELLERYERKILKDDYIENPTILPCNGMSIEKFGLTNLGEPDTAVGSRFVDGKRFIRYLWKSNNNRILAECYSYKHTLSHEDDDKVERFKYYGEQHGYDANGIYIGE